MSRSFFRLGMPVTVQRPDRSSTTLDCGDVVVPLLGGGGGAGSVACRMDLAPRHRTRVPTPQTVATPPMGDRA